MNTINMSEKITTRYPFRKNEIHCCSIFHYTTNFYIMQYFHTNISTSLWFKSTRSGKRCNGEGGYAPDNHQLYASQGREAEPATSDFTVISSQNIVEMRSRHSLASFLLVLVISRRKRIINPFSRSVTLPNSR